jgi:hypothetical protein
VDTEHHQVSGRRPVQQTRTTRKKGKDIDEPTYLDTITAEPAKRYYNAKGAKINNTTKVANHPPDPPRRQSIRPNSNMMTAAKHSPDQQHDNGGKASA